MKVLLKTAPVLEPIDLAALKLHLRVDSGSFADNIDETILIAPGSHAIAANYTTHIGTSKEVLGYTAVVVAQYGVLTVGGVVDIKIQESDDNATWADWTGGAFTQVTISAASSTQEKAYTGTKRYIRTVAKVITQAAEFSTTVIRLTATSVEDDLLTAIITASREHVEDITRRALLTQTWYYYLDEFPDEDFIKLPFGNLQSTGLVITYKDTDGTATTMTLTTDYLVETNGEGIGRIVLPYGGSWPTDTLYPSNPITVEFACGWTAAASIPKKIIAAVKLICADLYTNREGKVLSSFDYKENKAVKALLASSRLWDEFE
jgi:uncharacterized phiE125 gp8 family phage protein